MSELVGSGEFVEANAALIAAAPDLLAALKVELSRCDKDHGEEVHRAAKLAIAKAEGMLDG